MSKIGTLNKLMSKFAFLPVILARISIGWIFMTSGWGKLNNLENVIGYFDSIGIPMANVQAPMIAGIELIGGIALLIGLGTRYFSILLVGIMAVALLTAHAEDVSAITDLFKLYQFMYIILLGYLITQGAGKFSVDQVIKDKA